jgi:hypothetical protein
MTFQLSAHLFRGINFTSRAFYVQKSSTDTKRIFFEILKTEMFLALTFALILIPTELLSCLLHPRDLHSIFIFKFWHSEKSTLNLNNGKLLLADNCLRLPALRLSGSSGLAKRMKLLCLYKMTIWNTPRKIT